MPGHSHIRRNEPKSRETVFIYLYLLKFTCASADVIPDIFVIIINASTRFQNVYNRRMKARQRRPTKPIGSGRVAER